MLGKRCWWECGGGLGVCGARTHGACFAGARPDIGSVAGGGGAHLSLLGPLVAAVSVAVHVDGAAAAGGDEARF